MSTLRTLARWARDLNPADLPPAVRVRARLQHLSTAGAVRAVRARPVATRLAGTAEGKTAPLVPGGRGRVRDAVRVHAGLAAWLSYDDMLFSGRTSPGAVSAAWAGARGHTLDELICATVAANEIAGRVGCSLLLSSNGGEVSAAVHAVGAATALGLLSGLDAETLAHALALALSAPSVVPLSVSLGGGDGPALAAALSAAAGAEAVTLAAAGLRGPLDLLDARDGLLHSLAWTPLRAAFTGLGRTWLTETLSYKLTPGSIWHQPAVQGVAEILRRHVKAADKRLGVDQLERVEVAIGAPGYAQEQVMAEHTALDPATVPLSLRRSIAVEVVSYGLGPEQLEEGWLEQNRDELSEIARRVEVSHSWRHTLALVDHLVDVAAPLLAGLTLPELRAAGQGAARHLGVGLPAPTGAALLDVLRARPDRLFDRLRHSSGDLGDARLLEWQFQLGASIKLYTTRGGSWPEERALPEGSPGWPWDQTVAGVLRKSGLPQAAALLDAPGAEDGLGFVETLLG